MRGLTVFIFNVYNMRVLEGDGDDDKQPVYVIYIINAEEKQLIYTDCYCSGVVAGVKRFRVIALRYYVSELPSFCHHPHRSSPPPPVHGLVYSGGGGGSERVGSGGVERKTVKARVFRGYNVFLRALPLDTSGAGQLPPPPPPLHAERANDPCNMCQLSEF